MAGDAVPGAVSIATCGHGWNRSVPCFCPV